MKNSRFDVTSLGSTMLRLSVPNGKRLEYADSLDVKIGGTESNTMVALSKMGLRTAWVSRLTDNAVGERVVNEICAHGVDTSKVVWVDKDRNELYFIEFGSKPRRIEVLYDRTNSAISKIKFDEIDKAYLFDTRIFHFTGIFSALSKNCLEVSQKVLATAKKAGVKTSFDINYRSKLWSISKARKSTIPIMKKVDLLFISEQDACDILGISGDDEYVAKKMYETFNPEISIVALGTEGGMAFDGSKVYKCKCIEAEEVDRVGRGDCFMAGFICGYLEGSIQKGLDYGSAMAAIKMTIAGDVFLSNRDEVCDILDKEKKRDVGR